MNSERVVSIVRLSQIPSSRLDQLGQLRGSTFVGLNSVGKLFLPRQRGSGGIGDVQGKGEVIDTRSGVVLPSKSNQRFAVRFV